MYCREVLKPDSPLCKDAAPFVVRHRRPLYEYPSGAVGRDQLGSNRGIVITYVGATPHQTDQMHRGGRSLPLWSCRR